MTDQISLRGLEVFAYHGVLPQEAIKGQIFLIDIDLFIDTLPAGSLDELSRTVDYGKLADDVVAVSSAERHDLIETLAHEIAGVCMARDAVSGCAVTVHKPSAPIQHVFDDVSVTVRYPR